LAKATLSFESRYLEVIPLTGHVVKSIWPALNRTEEVNNNGTVRRIGYEVETYTVNSGRITKTFLILVEEEDTGTLGQDEFGERSVEFELTPNMSRITKSALITLRNQGNNEGQVKVTLVAQQI
jgi:hypothetical protein